MAGGSIHVKVDPRKLLEESRAVESTVSAIKKDFDYVRSIVNGTSYWQGDAEKKHKKIFSDNEEDIREILKRLGEHPVDLRKMAGVYSDAEQENEQRANRLPDGVIS